MNMNRAIQLGNVTVGGDFNLVTAENIQNSFNKATSADASEDMKENLKVLAVQVAELAKRLPNQKAEQVASDLQSLTNEALSKQPRQQWYQLSAQGLLEAAKTVAEMTAPITSAVKAVLALLTP